jgi:hypothetical protein
MKEDTTKKSPWQTWEDVFKDAGFPKRHFCKDVIRPITMEEGRELHFLRGGDTWNLQHYVIEIPDNVLEHKKTLAKVLEKNGASKTAIMEIQKVYLGDYLLDLGDNCIFDKYATGCGGTTLALKDDRDCIVAVPSRELVDNKRFYREKQVQPQYIDKGNGLIETEFVTYYTQSEREDLFCIYSGLNDSLDALKKYYNEVMSDPKRRLKIVCTYDQVSKVVGWLLGRSIGYNPNTDSRPCFLYLDEMQEIYDAYQKSPDDGKDRRESIKKMLEVINTFKHVVVISATIVAERFFFKELLDPNRFKVYHVKFPEGSTERICLHLRGCEYPRTELVAELRKYLRKDNPIPSNAHVFLNSVREILGIIKELGILENARKFKVVCSTKDDTNVEKFRKAIEQAIRKKYKLGKSESVSDIFALYDGLANFYNSPIGSTINPPKKINFYTARAFSGCDIFDADAQPYIVTLDPSKVNQVFDVSTKFKQVVGRLRDSARPPVYIYMPGEHFDKVRQNATGDQTKDDIADEKDVEETATDILSTEAKNRRVTDGLNEDYLNRFGLSRDSQTNTIVRDTIIAAQNAMSRRSFRDIASVTTISAAARRENDWSVYVETIEPKRKKVEDEEPVEVPNIAPSNIEVKPRTRTLSFKNAYLAYIKIRQNLDNGVQPTQAMDAEITFYERKFPYLKEIYMLLTPDDVESTHYSAKACQNLVSERNVQNSRSKILEELKLQIPLNTFREQKERKVWTNYFKKKYNLTKFKLSDYGTVKRVMTNKTVIAGEDLFGPIKKVIKIDGFMVTEWLDK